MGKDGKKSSIGGSPIHFVPRTEHGKTIKLSERQIPKPVARPVHTPPKPPPEPKKK